ncbi:MAG TPA: penicillin acylase family protein [Chloroflexota bacterium]|nr:penicillin acylase family protein [Chloroflexota bacterium]
MRFFSQQWSKGRLPQVDGRIYLPSLQHPVTIRRDRWGIPHIEAQNRHDLLRAQGFVHAQERFWQMELNRRAAAGTLSELFGNRTLDTDRLARTLGFARLARQTWAVLPPDVQFDLIAYAQGVNDWLTTCPSLPIEFSLIQHQPAAWEPVDSVAYGRLQMWALTNGASGEFVQAQLTQSLSPEMAADWGLCYPATNPSTLPHGIEIGGLKLDGLVGAWTNPFQGKAAFDGLGRGSNGWVIAPERSATGRAILCNDMHLPMGTPSLWVAMHLRSQDGLHVTGFSQPGLPYVLVGHNEHIAWGATLSYVDCEDFFLERLHPHHPGYYEFMGQWQAAEVVTEMIRVRGRPSHQERIIVTQHGPLVNGPFANGVLVDYAQPVAYCSTALQPDVGLDGFRRLNEAKDWGEFVTAVAHIYSPSLNLLYADRQGNIGYYVSGRAPIRTKGDGLTPVPGWTGEYEWMGYIPFAEMPHALNPAQGYIVSANHRIVGDAYPHYLGNVWRNGYRARRIEEMINARPTISLADCRAMHRDVTHIPGQELVKLLAELETSEPDAALALWLLREWDGRLTTDSVGGMVYEVLVRQLSAALLTPHFARPFREQLLGKGGHPLLQPVNDFQGQWLVSLLHILGEGSARWGVDEALLVGCLAQTTAVLRQKLGPDPATWQWGRLHRVTFAHALGVAPVLGRLFNQGPYPIGGDENTVLQTGIRADLPYDNNAISVSTRLIVDLGEGMPTWGIHPPGQSGHVGSPHYGDLIQPWLDGAYYQMAWDEAAVMAVTRHILALRPCARHPRHHRLHGRQVMRKITHAVIG